LYHNARYKKHTAKRQYFGFLKQQRENDSSTPPCGFTEPHRRADLPNRTAVRIYRSAPLCGFIAPHRCADLPNPPKGLFRKPDESAL